MAILVVDKITKRFGGFQVLQDVSLKVEEGSITGLVGPNGSGKSTLLSTVFGFYKPDGGDVYFKGDKITALPPHDVYKKGIAFAFQIPRLFFKLTVLDNLLMAARDHVGTTLDGTLFLRKKWKNQELELARRAFEILELLDLSKLVSHKAGVLSGGQRKLLEIGKALMASPDMIFLDEPAAGINPVLSRKIYQNLIELKKKGMTFLVVEHKLEVLLEFADYVYMMDSGKILLSGKPKEVINDPLFYNVYVGEAKDVVSS
ncbi:ABC transporter ATP-binding protein [Peptococcaceae bacterium]|nr:ABC transporter ATP-binding protein [Peptococcaceae bacterium]